ncbi:hypothetical protein CDAR_608511 [Caerostris darwini]|uniref:Uncharacterized protein n=1 Tax=Caerostris darwini TaxID=1538125 RepID=A0AAV4WJD5_9ARAC|nr:hypothetical protein CDAR_608511 [Caerostris darwini]
MCVFRGCDNAFPRRLGTKHEAAYAGVRRHSEHTAIAFNFSQEFVLAKARKLFPLIKRRFKKPSTAKRCINASEPSFLPHPYPSALPSSSFHIRKQKKKNVMRMKTEREGDKNSIIAFLLTTYFGRSELLLEEFDYPSSAPAPHPSVQESRPSPKKMRRRLPN